MLKLAAPRFLPWLDILGLALTLLALAFPEIRNAWVMGTITVLCSHTAFWAVVDLHQRGLLTKRVGQIHRAVQASPRRSRFEQSAFIVAAAILQVAQRF